MKTLTKYVDLDKLNSHSTESIHVIRLMMACNDISLANHCNIIFNEEIPSIKKYLIRGAKMYFLRIQYSHLNEAMSIIKDINENTKLRNFIHESCSSQTQNIFKELTDYVQGGSKEKEFERNVKHLRDKVTFHYGKSEIQQALSKRKKRTSSMTLADNINHIRFEIADDIADSIVCRNIWKVEHIDDYDDEFIRNEVDKHAEFGMKLCKLLFDFSGEFIEKYITKYALKIV